jgi:hypothetical protein
MARTYHRDKLGRFASKGFSGQSAGRGARLMASGSRAGGGAKITAVRAAGTLRKPKGLKPQAGASVPQKPGTVQLSQVKRYNALDRARRKQKQNYSREISRVTGSTDRRRAEAAAPRAALASRKISRIESTMRRLSNSPNSPNVPVLPRAKSLGNRITQGRYTFAHGKAKPSIRSGAIANTVKRPPSRPAPRPTGSRARQQAAAAQRQRRGQVLSQTRPIVLGLGQRRNKGLASRVVGTQLSIVGRPRQLKRYGFVDLNRRR